MSLDIAIRIEMPADGLAVRRLNELAFGRTREADLVDRLRAGCPRLVSLVVVAVGKLVVHILFSPAVVAGSHGSLSGMAWRPLPSCPSSRGAASGRH